MVDDKKDETAPPAIQDAVNTAWRAFGKWWKAAVAFQAAALLFAFLALAEGWFKVAVDEATKTALVNELAENERFRSGVGARIGDVGAPIGSVVAWPVAKEVPSGWRICNGEVLVASEYPKLAALLDATYGAIGPDKVKLPDFQGYFLRGAGVTDAHQSNALGKPQGDQAESHRHESGDLAALVDFAKARLGLQVSEHAPWQPNWSASLSFDLQEPLPFAGATAVTGTTGPSIPTAPKMETRPANFAVHWIIRIK